MTDSPLENPLEKKPAAAPPSAENAVRASDADRDRVADILREALAEGRLDAQEHAERIDSVYAAKTVGELEPLVRDLPAGRGGPAGAGHAAAGPRYRGHYAPYADMTGPHKENLVSIFSGTVRKGHWSVPAKINAFACFGGVEIDLTEAVFTYQHVVINATAIFGGVDIKVAENVTLRQKGAGIFGGFDVRTFEAPDPEAPVILVKGAAVFGGVEAKPKRGRWLRDLRERLRKEL